MFKFSVGDVVVYVGGYGVFWNRKVVGEQAVVLNYYETRFGKKFYILDKLGKITKYIAFEGNLELALPKIPDWEV